MEQTESNPLRYVVLRHEGVERPHYDLLFETSAGSMLAAWRAENWPVTDGDEVEALPDHRRAYLEYEGPVSGNRGVVKRVHMGRHAVVQNDSAALLVRLNGGCMLRLPRATGIAEVNADDTD